MSKECDGRAGKSPSPGPYTRDRPDPSANPAMMRARPGDAGPGPTRNATGKLRPWACAGCHVGRPLGSFRRLAGPEMRKAPLPRINRVLQRVPAAEHSGSDDVHGPEMAAPPGRRIDGCIVVQPLDRVRRGVRHGTLKRRRASVDEEVVPGAVRSPEPAGPSGPSLG